MREGKSENGIENQKEKEKVNIWRILKEVKKKKKKWLNKKAIGKNY